MAASPFINLSEEMVHQAAKAKGGHTDAVSLPSMRAGLEESGQCLLELWPYEWMECDLKPSARAVADGATRRAQLNRLDTAFQKIKESILQNRPVILVLGICEAFFSTTTGFVATPKAEEIIPGLHAVLATGIWSSRGMTERLEFRNSWGTTWGDRGYGWIEESYVNSHVVSAVRVEAA